MVVYVSVLERCMSSFVIRQVLWILNHYIDAKCLVGQIFSKHEWIDKKWSISGSQTYNGDISCQTDMWLWKP